MEIQYFIYPHNHPLRLKDGMEEDDGFRCGTCGLSVGGDSPFYACDTCGFCLHKPCAPPPHRILNPVHRFDHGPLTLLAKITTRTRCDSCFRHIKDAAFYSCGACYFKMEAECALRPATTLLREEGEKWIKHFSHTHYLLLIETDEFRCAVCDQFSSGSQSAYGCLECDYFLDESCAELPMQIVHHPRHAARPLLALPLEELFYCQICETFKQGRCGFSFVCSHCRFQVCVKCAKDVTRCSRNIKYEDHDHPLYLVVDAELSNHCSGYDDYCAQSVVLSSKEFMSTKSYMLWCWECEFKVHLLCGPLPSVIKHQCHIHPLVLLDSLREDDSSEYYCDVCETERDPRIRLYCCRECKYFAHVKCVISEIEKTLKGESKDMKLKTPGQDIWEHHKLTIGDDVGQREKPALTRLREVMDNEMSEEDRVILRIYYKWDETSSKDDKRVKEDSELIISSTSTRTRSSVLLEEDIDELLRLTCFTEIDFQSLFSNFHHFYLKNKLDFKSSDLEMKMVKVKGYTIPHSLAKVLNTLFNEFGDISGSEGSLEMKSFVFFIVCKVVKSMHSTMAKGLTQTLLRDWYFHLMFAWVYGFRIDFAWEKLEQLAKAFLCFQAKRLEHEIPTVLKDKLVWLQLRLEKCNEYCGSSPKPEFMKECFDIASKLEWEDTLEDLFQHKDNQ